MIEYMLMIDSQEDRTKFEQLYLEYQGLMYHIAYQILQNPQDAEDAVHQAFVKIAEIISTVDEPLCARTKGFVATIVENKAIDISRYNYGHSTAELTDNVMGMRIDYEGENTLAFCMSKLSARYREAISLKYCYGYTIAEIARIMDITESNAAKLEQRAKKKLRGLCQEEGLL